MWDHSHINNDTHRLPHIWPYIFTPPLHQPQTPVFAKNCHPKSQCHTVQVSRILEIFHSKTPNRLEFEKKVPKCRLFCYGFCHWKTPYFFALHTHVCLRGMLPQTRSEAGKFCFLETESSNLGNTFRCKVMKINFISTGSTDPIVHYMDEFHWRAGMIQAIIHLVKHGRGYILQTPSINLHLVSLKKCQAYLRMCKRRHFKCKVQCRARWRARENFEI